MSQDKLSLVKKFRLSPREASMLADKAQQANMTESEYLRLMISQKLFLTGIIAFSNSLLTIFGMIQFNKYMM